MLQFLSINNYAIIKSLDIRFNEGFSVITGETGAGKSIVLGALGLILGQRADTSVLKDNTGKCVVEGIFQVDKTEELIAFFVLNDLDYDTNITLRREIAPNGKSRAFINDTPVQLNIIRELGLKIIDIHSQHANLELSKRQFQLNVIDWYAGNQLLLSNYSKEYKQLRKLEQEYAEMQDTAANAKKDLDYFEFQFNQLYEANLIVDEQDELESEQEMLSHAEEIQSGLMQVHQSLEGEEFAALKSIKDSVAIVQRLGKYLSAAQDLATRLESQYIELKDIAAECEQLAEKAEFNPTRLEEVNERLNMIYSLQQKHRVDNIAELIALRDEFDAKIQSANSFDDELLKLEKNIHEVQSRVKDLASQLHQARSKQLPSITAEIETILKQLGMPNSTFTIDIKESDGYHASGRDEVYFLFCANKGGRLEEINKVASGGELSRLMLAIKTVVAKSKALPAIIFDEIDTGISGEIANKMADILGTMSQYMQVINITHLPQIASKGKSHYLVFKEETDKEELTGMRLLNNEERVLEIAKMLSGAVPTQAALDNARSLISN